MQRTPTQRAEAVSPKAEATTIGIASEHFPAFHNPLGFLSSQTIEHQQWESACSAFRKEMFWEPLQRWAAPIDGVPRVSEAAEQEQGGEEVKLVDGHRLPFHSE
jgi:hypothetical protein